VVLFGLGGGSVFVPLTSASLVGVRQEDSGAASSLVNVMQQVGGSLGLAVLVAVFGTAYRDAAHGSASAAHAAHAAFTHGVSVAFSLATVFDVAALALIILLIRGRAPQPTVAEPPAPARADADADADASVER
jgi:hypothetical protein